MCNFEKTNTPKPMKRTFPLWCCLFIWTTLTAQSAQAPYWTATKQNPKTQLEWASEFPQKLLFILDKNRWNATLAPLFKETSGPTISVVLPTGNSTFATYQIHAVSNFAPGLQKKFPQIQSFEGYNSQDGSQITGSWSPLGLRAMIMTTDKKIICIEPVSTDYTTYTVFSKTDIQRFKDDFVCKIPKNMTGRAPAPAASGNADDGTQRKYRLAVSATGEYTRYFGGTKAQALAAINTTIGNVNFIYNNDFAIKLELIANNDKIIFTSPEGDRYQYPASSAYTNTEVQQTITDSIGEANYDIGHVFMKGPGGGDAGCIGCICVNNQKGSGFTSRVNPTGVGYDIDYVAHELGHQLGANHTFSYAIEGTGVNVEPGSGSTIMGYAGITPKDVQLTTDPYFHYASIKQVMINVKGKACGTTAFTNNNIPFVDAGANYSIPKSTPFVLEGDGHDADNDVVTYTWEQIDDASNTNDPVDTKADGPMFRSYTPTTGMNRYLPKMSSIMAGQTTTQGAELVVEALASVARTYEFALTGRDSKAGGGGNMTSKKTVTVVGAAGPFKVTSQATATTITSDTRQTITWDVAGTTANGINCTNVDIYYTLDGGNSWNTWLTGTPNDGTENLDMPTVAANNGNFRIMVRGAGNIFFAVNSGAITLTPRTKLAAGSCNITVASLSTTLFAITVPGATRYRFNISKANVSWVVEKTNNSFSLMDLPAGDAVNNAIYTVKVAAEVNGIFTHYGDSCTVTTPAPETTNLNSGYCNVTASSKWTSFFCRIVSGATAYRFQLVNGNTTLTYDSATNRFCFNNIAGWALSTTYSVTVAYQKNGSWSSFGSACNLTSPANNNRLVQTGSELTGEIKTVPNPFGADFSLIPELRTTGNARVLVYDLTGKQIESRDVDMSNLQDLSWGSAYSPGVYQIVIETSTDTLILRAVKQ